MTEEYEIQRLVKEDRYWETVDQSYGSLEEAERSIRALLFNDATLVMRVERHTKEVLSHTYLVEMTTEWGEEE